MAVADVVAEARVNWGRGFQGIAGRDKERRCGKGMALPQWSTTQVRQASVFASVTRGDLCLPCSTSTGIPRDDGCPPDAGPRGSALCQQICVGSSARGVRRGVSDGPGRERGEFWSALWGVQNHFARQRYFAKSLSLGGDITWGDDLGLRCLRRPFPSSSEWLAVPRPFPPLCLGDRT